MFSFLFRISMADKVSWSGRGTDSAFWAATLSRATFFFMEDRKYEGVMATVGVEPTRARGPSGF